MSGEESTSTKLHQILKKYWGYKVFRPLQEEIIKSVLCGKDTLGLMPTGGGKSITFQVPGLFFPDGLTIVVTPLVSLMKDQVDNLKSHRVKAVYLHAGMTAKENKAAWENLINGKARFLYVSPEKLQNDRFLVELKNLKVNLITIDEAHCISQWGYDFRPSYLNIKKLRRIKPEISILALTATATPEVSMDIMRQLEFREPNILKKSFTRDNISYIVRKSDTKVNEVKHILSRTTGSAIVYVRSRKRTKEIAEYLNDSEISATYYHANMDNNVKSERQNDWKDGKVRVMVATNAFGMGIDKPDVRVVIHYDIPQSLEEYYQEAGRAGRDGKNSYAVLLINQADRRLLRSRITENFPERKTIKNIYEEICINLHLSIGEGYETIKEFDILKFCKLFGRQEKQCRSSLRLLSQAGYMHFLEDIDKRSRLKMLVEREELYYLEGLSTNSESVLSSILRLYTGLFADYVYIRESEIALHIHLSENDVYQALLDLDKKKILNYIPRSGLPLIYMPTAREDKGSLMIGKDIYEDRKKSMTNRIESVIDYAFADKSCRVKRMLSYFGETTGSDCGKCDICRDKRKSVKQEQEKEEDNLKRLLEYLKAHPEGSRFIAIETYCGRDKLTTARLLNYLCNEGYVISEQNLYFPNF